MPGLALEDGEVQLLAELAESIAGGNRHAESRIVLTDRRVVLLTSEDDLTRVGSLRGGLLGAFRFGVLRLARLVTGKADPDATREIRRAAFAEVVAGDEGRVAFRVRVGDGFVIRSMTPFETWQQRMHQWEAGTLGAEPLPTAKIVR